MQTLIPSSDLLVPSVSQYDELESLREELKQKDKEFEDLQSVKVSQAFTDHSITPDSSIMNVRASFTEKVKMYRNLLLKI